MLVNISHQELVEVPNDRPSYVIIGNPLHNGFGFYITQSFERDFLYTHQSCNYTIKERIHEHHQHRPDRQGLVVHHIAFWYDVSFGSLPGLHPYRHLPLHFTRTLACDS